MSVIEIADFSDQGWNERDAGPARSRWCCERLEDGDILLLPATPLVSEDERSFLTSVRQTGSGFVKNISFEASTGRLRGYVRSGTDSHRLRAILREYCERTWRAANLLLSPYAPALQVDFTSFRPIEEEGRRLKGRSRNDLLHVDAFPTRPARGRRILRFFTNIHPTQPRVWITSESFAELARRMAPDAGLAGFATGSGGPMALARRQAAGALRAAGIPLADRSTYDRFMLRFHDYLKDNRTFQAQCARHRHQFPPGATWIAFTDIVSHAVLSGRYALEQTFFVPIDAMLAPHKSPLRILESMAGASLN